MKLNRWLLAALCVSSLPAAGLFAAPQAESRSITITATVGDEEDAKTAKQSKDGSENPAPAERKTLRIELNKGPVVMLKRIASRDDAGNATADGDSAEEKQPKGPSRVWLGIGLKDIEGDLATYLGSSDGVFVQQVFADSPAAEAKLQIGDVLIAFNGEKLSDPDDMLEQLQQIKPLESNDKADAQSLTYPKVTLTLLRRGKEEKLELTPRARPDHLKLSGSVAEEAADVAKIFKFGSPAGSGFNFVKPFTNVKNNIVIVTKEDGKETTVRVQRDGEGPAKIVVSDGSQERELTEDQLDQLPEKLRDAVQKALKTTQTFQFKSSQQSSNGIPEGGRAEVEIDDAFVKAQLEKAMKQVGGSVELKDLSESLKGLAKGGVIVIDPDKLQDVRKMSEEAQEMAKKWAEGRLSPTHGSTNMPEQLKQLKQQVEELKQQVEELRGEVKASKK